MRTIQQTIYKYNELSTKAQKYALEKWQRNFDFEPCLDVYIERLKGLGFIDPVIHYDLSFSQGSGSCFDAEINLETIFNSDKIGKRLKRICLWYKKAYNEDPIYIVKNSWANHYCHEKTRSIEHVFGSNRPILKKLFKFAENFITDFYRIECKSIHKSLEDDFLDQQSEESFKEACEANEWEFYDDGSLV